MSQCVVPDWNLRHQRQEQVPTDQEQARRFPQVYAQLQNLSTRNFGTMPSDEVAELAWENGQLAMQGLGGLLHSGPAKPTWGRANGTLESIVHQATCHHNEQKSTNVHQQGHQINPATKKPPETSSSYRTQSEPASSRKRRWLDSNVRPDCHTRDSHVDQSACASGSATFCRDHNDTNIMPSASFDSLASLLAKTTDEDSACLVASEQDEDRDNKTEMTARSHSSRRNRSAAVHNLSERRRRDRINQKMRALQKMVPNASKTDKASMLDEVITYLKQLQAQVQLMSSARNSTTTAHPQVMMPLAMQHHLQMSLLAARMGMGVGLGAGVNMFDMNNLARATPPCLPPFVHPAMATASMAATPTTFVPPPHLVLPTMVPPHVPARPNKEVPSSSCSVPLTDAYRNFLAQSMNIDLYSKMAALWGQRINQDNQATSNAQSNSSLRGD